jgi:hypothetical protein
VCSPRKRPLIPSLTIYCSRDMAKTGGKCLMNTSSCQSSMRKESGSFMTARSLALSLENTSKNWLSASKSGYSRLLATSPSYFSRKKFKSHQRSLNFLRLLQNSSDWACSPNSQRHNFGSRPLPTWNRRLIEKPNLIP